MLVSCPASSFAHLADDAAAIHPNANEGTGRNSAAGGRGEPRGERFLDPWRILLDFRGGIA